MADRSVTVVLIAKITDFERGMAAATASTKRFEAELDKLRITTPRKLDAVGAAAKGTGRDIDKLSAAAKVGGAAVNDLGDEAAVAARKTDALGDEAAEAGRDMLTMAARIEAAKLALHGLSMEFAGSGDASLTPKIRQARRELSELERVAKFLTPGDGKSGWMGAAAGGAKGGLSGLGALGSNLRGAMIPIAIGAVALLSPIIGSAIGAAVVGGVATGGIIGGIVLASKDQRVRAAWGTVGEGLSKEFSDASVVFITPLIEGAKHIDKAFKDLKPTIDETFAGLAEAVEPLSRGGAGFLTNLGPGMKDLAAVGGPLMQDLAHELPNIGNAISNMFQSFRQGGPEMRGFFKDFLGFTKGAIVGLGEFAEFSAKAYDRLKIGFQSMNHFINTLGQSTNVQEGLVRRQLEVMEGVPAMQLHMAATGMQVAQGWTTQAEAAEMLAEMVEMANREFHDFVNTQLGAINASVAWEQAWDDMTDSVKQNGTSLDVHTQKGRNNIGMMERGVQAAEELYDRDIALGKGLAVADAAFEANIGQIRDHMIALGMNRRKVDELIAGLRSVPKNTPARVALLGLEALKASFLRIQGWFNSVRDKNVTIRVSTVNVNGGRSGGAQAMRWGGITEHAQDGLLNQAGLYGAVSPARYAFAEPQTGGEAFVPRKGDYGRSMSIISAAAGWYNADVVPRKWTGAGGGGSGGTGQMSMNFNVSGASTPFERALAEALRSMTLTLGGGNVQTAFGRR